MYWVTYTVVRRSTIPILFGCKLTLATCSEAAFYSKDTDKLSRIEIFLSHPAGQFLKTQILRLMRQRKVLLRLHFLQTREGTLELKRQPSTAIELLNWHFR